METIPAEMKTTKTVLSSAVRIHRLIGQMYRVPCAFIEQLTKYQRVDVEKARDRDGHVGVWADRNYQQGARPVNRDGRCR
jgi:hypothetical protein